MSVSKRLFGKSLTITSHRSSSIGRQRMTKWFSLICSLNPNLVTYARTKSNTTADGGYDSVSSENAWSGNSISWCGRFVLQMNENMHILRVRNGFEKAQKSQLHTSVLGTWPNESELHIGLFQFDQCTTMCRQSLQFARTQWLWNLVAMRTWLQLIQLCQHQLRRHSKWMTSSFLQYVPLSQLPMHSFHKVWDKLPPRIKRFRLKNITKL